MFTRHALNPLITPQTVAPSRPDFSVIGSFNAGVIIVEGQVLLLVRVAERPIQSDRQSVLYPHMTPDGEIHVRAILHDDDRYDLSDARLIRDRKTDRITLTSISHLRRAFSQDGVHFTIDAKPWLSGEPPYETFGVEDARISCIDGQYVVNYSAVSPYGIATALIFTRDFKHIERHGIILPPDNRDVTIFPERIEGKYVAYHRPMPGFFGDLNIWLTTSPDLRHWGSHRLVLETQSGGWESGRVGGGAPPMRTERGWLSIYHAATLDNRYCLGAFLTPLDDPGRVIARSREPILSPTAPYETGGFFPNVVFTCGALLNQGILKLYYGASDESMALAEAPLIDVMKSLTES